MEGQTFIEEIDCGNIFDHFDDLIEFPSVTDNYVDSNEFANIWTNDSDGLHGSDSIFSYSNGASALSAELDVPYEDMVQLEWLSNFVEDSFSGGGMTINKENVLVKNEPLAVTNYQFQTSSPTSVLESSSSSSSSSPSYSGSGDNSGGGNGGGGRMIPLSPTHRGPQRARTKRPRPPAFHPRATIGLLSSSNLVQVPISMESDNTPKMGSSGPEQKKRKKKPEAQAVDPEDKSENHNKTGQGVRKCLHCEITKTPQWRAGPMGPKTLCNACGVRYKSGRLFPEYRPAASPTFVPSLHSNSHRKVVEMRCKAMVIGGLPEPEPELIPNLNPPPADYI